MLPNLVLVVAGGSPGSKPYKYIGLGAPKAPNLTNIMVWELPKLQTLQI